MAPTRGKQEAGTSSATRGGVARRREQYPAGCGTIGKREGERGQVIQPTT